MYVIECGCRSFRVDDLGAAKFLLGFFLKNGMKEVYVHAEEDEKK